MKSPGQSEAIASAKPRPFLALRRRAKRQSIRRVATCAAALFGGEAHGKVGILMYHRVAEHPRGARNPTWNVTPRQFRYQMEGLLASGFRPWPLQKVIEYGRGGLEVDPRAFVVTFDDGYEGVHRYAWPVLRDLGIPATVFLATAYVDTCVPFPFDDWAAAGSARVPPDAWRIMSLVQCKELAADGVIELGAHTHTHRDFRGRPADLVADLLECAAFMRTNFGLTTVTFAFPFGYAGPALADAARQAGVLCGLTTQEQLADPAGDPFFWGRFEVDGSDSPATIGACLTGWEGSIRHGRPQRAVRDFCARIFAH